MLLKNLYVSMAPNSWKHWAITVPVSDHRHVLATLQFLTNRPVFTEDCWWIDFIWDCSEVALSLFGKQCINWKPHCCLLQVQAWSSMLWISVYIHKEVYRKSQKSVLSQVERADTRQSLLAQCHIRSGRFLKTCIDWRFGWKCSQNGFCSSFWGRCTCDGMLLVGYLKIYENPQTRNFDCLPF